MNVAARAARVLLAAPRAASARGHIHYLGDRAEAEVLLPSEVGERVDRGALETRIEALLAARPEYRAISVFVRLAPR